MIQHATYDLGPTATYRIRLAVWLSLGTGFVTTPAGEIVPGAGKLTIKLQKGRGVGCKCETDTYAVAETEPQHPGTRAFLMLNLTDATQREPYLVHVGGVHTCRCKAGICRVPTGCKHRDALEAVIADGMLEPEEPEPVPAPRTEFPDCFKLEWTRDSVPGVPF